jgi:DNA-binding transcriptional LysR family regulator
VLAAQMERGDVDLALMTPESAPEELRMVALYHERYVAIVRKGHPRVSESIDLDLFCDLDHVVVSPQGGGFRGPADTALEAVGRTRRVVLSAPAFLVVPGIIARSDMIALVPERVARDHKATLRAMDPPVAVPGFDIAMVWHDRLTTHPIQKWLREKVVRAARRKGEASISP